MPTPIETLMHVAFYAGQVAVRKPHNIIAIATHLTLPLYPESTMISAVWPKMDCMTLNALTWEYTSAGWPWHWQKIGLKPKVKLALKTISSPRSCVEHACLIRVWNCIFCKIEWIPHSQWAAHDPWLGSERHRWNNQLLTFPMWVSFCCESTQCLSFPRQSSQSQMISWQ